MITLIMVFLIVLMFSIPNAIAQRGGESFNLFPQHTIETDREVLRLIRNEKLDLILPGAMRDNIMKNKSKFRFDNP